jgi:uncharacterized protein
MTRALLLHGGWEGHEPERVADFAASRLLASCEIVRSTDLNMLEPDVLARFDLLVPIWTFGELSNTQETALLNAVAGGLGMVAWHGAASSFLNSRPHKFLLGGQFVGHPGGNELSYLVNFANDDPLVAGIQDVRVTSEQYYLLVDPAVSVLATTAVHGDGMNWIAGVRMPVIWKRSWGQGRVFYCSLGHDVSVLEHPCISTVLRRAVRWAIRHSDQPY